MKAWKASATLPAFDTAHPARVEGLMWAASAAALKRFGAHLPQRLTAVPMAPRQVALGARHVFGDVREAWKRGARVERWAVWEAALTCLACQAPRAQPERDRQRGRRQLGLEPYLEHADGIEFAEAASVLTYEARWLQRVFAISPEPGIMLCGSLHATEGSSSSHLLASPAMCTRTAPDSGAGSGIAPMWNTSAAPLRSCHTARTVAPPVVS